MPTIYSRHTGRPVFEGPSFERAIIRAGEFRHVDLWSANFSFANLEDCDFSDVQSFHYASFAGANLVDCIFPSMFSSTVNFAGARSNTPIPGWKMVDGTLTRRSANSCLLCDERAVENCHHCEDHCNHNTCPSCDTCIHGVTTCSYCENCSDCCECVSCERCGDIIEDNSQCDECSNCEDCCGCNDTYGDPIPHKPGDKFNCTRMVGVEWEFNDSVRLRDWKKKWGGGVHEDGSCGYEAVTPPVAGDAIEKCLKDLGQGLKDYGTAIDSRCGIHVHVDAKDLSWNDMYRLLWVYGKLEPFLYLLAGQHRAKLDEDGGSYCAPVGKDYIYALSEIDRKGSVLAVALNWESGKSAAKIREILSKKNRMDKKGQGRYRGLNILPWLAGRAYKIMQRRRDAHTGKLRALLVSKSDSTVEFRMHRNTDDATRVIGWAQVCARLVDWCAKATDKEAQALPKSALRALIHIAPDCREWILQRVRAWRRSTSYNERTGRRKVRRMIKYTPKSGYVLNV